MKIIGWLATFQRLGGGGRGGRRKNVMGSRGLYFFLFTHCLRDLERLNSPFSPIAFKPRGRLIEMNVIKHKSMTKQV